MSEKIHEVLAAHFVMWHDLPRADKPGALNPSGEWRCACGLKFGFSDSAIGHVAERVAAEIADTERVLGQVKALRAEMVGMQEAGASLVARSWVVHKIDAMLTPASVPSERMDP